MPTEYFIPASKKAAVKLNNSQQQSLTAGSLDRWSSWYQMTQDIRTRALEAMQLYSENRPESETTQEPDDTNGSRVRRPVLAEAIDSTLAQQHLSSFPSDERFFKGKAKNAIARDLMSKYERHVEKRLSDIDFMINALKNRKNKQICGVSAVWHPFIRKTEKRVSYDFPSLLGVRLTPKPVKSVKQQVTFEGTGFIPLNLEDWQIDPTVDTLDETNFIWRRWMSLEEIKDIEAFQNTDAIEALSKQSVQDEGDSNKDSAYLYMGIETTMDTMGESHALLYEEWGDFYLDDEFYENHVLIYSNNGVFHYFGPNPYDHQKKPFTVAPYNPQPGTLFGKSQAQDIIPLCHALDSMLNQQIDAFGIVANSAFTYVVRDTALQEYFSDGPVSVRPGEGIPVQEHENLRPIQWPIDALTISEGAQQRLKEEIRESTGGVPYATGGVSALDQERTATETNILASGTNTRFQLLIQIDEEQCLKPYLGMIFENDRQFMTADAYVEDEDESLTVNEVKMMDLCFDVTGSKTIMSRAREIQDIDTILAAIPNWKAAGLIELKQEIPVISLAELLKRRLTLTASLKDTDNFMEVITQEEIQEEAPELGGLPPELMPEAMNGLGAISGLEPGQAPGGLAVA